MATINQPADEPSMLTEPKKCKIVDQIQPDGTVKSVRKCRRVRRAVPPEDGLPRNEELDKEVRQSAIEKLKEWAAKPSKLAALAKDALQKVASGAKLAQKKASEKIRRIPKKARELKEQAAARFKDVQQKDAAKQPVAVLQDTERMMLTLDEVFFVLASEEEVYNRVAFAMTGFTRYGPAGSSTSDLPYDFFMELTNGTEDPHPGAGAERTPGRFYQGEEEQWDAAVRELYSSMVQRLDDLWKALVTYSENNESWLMWTTRWFVTSLQVDVVDASVVMALCKKAMLLMCKDSESKYAACSNPLLKGAHLQLDLNKQWSRHCTADSRVSYEGSMICGLGDGSKFANFLTRIVPVPLPANVRNFQYDWVVWLCNLVLYMLLSPRDYRQELIDDMNLLPPPLTPKETARIKDLEEQRDSAPTAHSAYYIKEITRWWLKGPPESDSLTRLRETKRLRITQGKNYVFQDLDWAIKYLEFFLQSDTLRAQFNAYIAPYGIAVPAKEVVGGAEIGD